MEFAIATTSYRPTFGE